MWKGRGTRVEPFLGVALKIPFRVPLRVPLGLLLRVVFVMMTVIMTMVMTFTSVIRITAVPPRSRQRLVPVRSGKTLVCMVRLVSRLEFGMYYNAVIPVGSTS